MSLRRDDRSNFGRELALAPPVMATMRRRRSARWARRRFKTSGTANVADFEYAAFDDRQRYSVQLLGCAEQRTSEIHASAAPRHLVTFDMIPLPRHDNAARPSFLGFYKHVVCQPVCNHLHRVEAGNDNRFLGALCLEKFTRWIGKQSRWPMSTARKEGNHVAAHESEAFERPPRRCAERCFIYADRTTRYEPVTSDDVLCPTTDVALPWEPGSMSR
jgi:hypothetical protein